MTDAERRALLSRLRSQPPDRRHSEHSSTSQPIKANEKQTVITLSDEWSASVADFALSLGWDISSGEIQRLAMGFVISFAGQPYIARADGCLYCAPVKGWESGNQDKTAALLRRVAVLRGLVAQF